MPVGDLIGRRWDTRNGLIGQTVVERGGHCHPHNHMHSLSSLTLIVCVLGLFMYSGERYRPISRQPELVSLFVFLSIDRLCSGGMSYFQADCFLQTRVGWILQGGWKWWFGAMPPHFTVARITTAWFLFTVCTFHHGAC